MANLITPGKGFLESLMQDTCDIIRDNEVRGDDVLDPLTLELLAPFDDTVPLHSGVSCIVTPETRRMEEYVQGGVEPKSEQVYRAYLPLEYDDIIVGDTFRLTAVGPENDESLIGVDMRVMKVFGGTFRPGRKLHVQHVTGDKDNARG